MIPAFFIDALSAPYLMIMSLFNVPYFPSQLTDNVNSFLDSIFNNSGLLSLFIRIETVKIGIPLILILLTIRYGYQVIMFIIRKIPFTGIT